MNTRLCFFCSETILKYRTRVHKVDSLDDFYLNHYTCTAGCPEVSFHFPVVSWQILAQQPIGCHGIPVPPEDPPLGTLHRTRTSGLSPTHTLQYITTTTTTTTTTGHHTQVIHARLTHQNNNGLVSLPQTSFHRRSRLLQSRYRGNSDSRTKCCVVGAPFSGKTWVPFLFSYISRGAEQLSFCCVFRPPFRAGNPRLHSARFGCSSFYGVSLRTQCCLAIHLAPLFYGGDSLTSQPLTF